MRHPTTLEGLPRQLPSSISIQCMDQMEPLSSLQTSLVLFRNAIKHQCTTRPDESFTVSLSHSLTLSLSHSLTVSLFHSLTLSLSHSLILTLSHSLNFSLSHSHSFTHYPHAEQLLFSCLCSKVTLTLSHSHTLTLSHSHTLSISHSLTLNMLNNFCFDVYAQKLLIIGENGTVFFDISIVL